MILVTGGTGLLGGHLLLELRKRKEEVRCLIRPETDKHKVFSVWKYYPDNPEELLDSIDWYQGDLLDKSSIEEAMVGTNKVYHCAAAVSFNTRDTKKLHNTNILGTRNLVDICLEKKPLKFLHVSSVAALSKSMYGKLITESNGWPVKNSTVYSYTKTRAEFEVWRGITEGLNAIIVNPSVILGPGDWTQSSSRIYEIVNNGIRYYTLGKTGYVGVQDVVKAMIILMESDVGGERYILNTSNISYKELFEKIALALNKRAPYKLATPFFLSLLWRIEFLISVITGKPPRLTKQSVKSANSIQEYSAKKFIEQFNYTFQSIDQVISETAKYYIK
ncbi:MAG: NAD-dependent epimerase/dehydratase family protein [Bacteroidales bacterium]|nr:NAD-dependent epimerase/dehydratase family protein [Bacteroidales bacterium]